MGRRWVLLVAVVGSLGAVLPVPEEALRSGNRALAQGDAVKALQHYEGAEARTTDPGLVAFNKGVAYAHLGESALAEYCFRLALQDASGARRARALYNQGVCLLKAAGPSDLAQMDAAIRALQECVACADTSGLLAEDARYNLELARLAWAEAAARSGASDGGSTGPDKPRAAPGGDGLPSTPEAPLGTPGEDDTGSPRKPGLGPETPRAEDRTGRPAPGAGNLPVLPDRGEWVPLSPGDAAAFLRRSVEKIAAERRGYENRRQKGELEGVPDW